MIRNLYSISLIAMSGLTLYPGGCGGNATDGADHTDASAEAGNPEAGSIDAGEAGSGLACGANATCDGRSQLCEHTTGGAPPGVDLYQCVAIPAACTGSVSCACVAAALQIPANRCAATSSGLTVEISTR
jgi:hypothetical protein